MRDVLMESGSPDKGSPEGSHLAAVMEGDEDEDGPVEVNEI